LCDPIRESRSLHQLEDERVHALRVFQAVNGADIWMIERREDLSFTLEAGKSRSASSANSEGRTFKATVRLSFVSRAR
jgi:hypothetical protein